MKLIRVLAMLLCLLLTASLLPAAAASGEVPEQEIQEGIQEDAAAPAEESEEELTEEPTEELLTESSDELGETGDETGDQTGDSTNTCSVQYRVENQEETEQEVLSAAAGDAVTLPAMLPALDTSEGMLYLKGLSFSDADGELIDIDYTFAQNTEGDKTMVVFSFEMPANNIYISAVYETSCAHQYSETQATEGVHAVCSVCGGTIHPWTGWQTDPDMGGWHYKLCSCEECEAEMRETCYGGSANCAEDAVCAVCGQVYRFADAHTWGEGVETRAATTTQEGEMTYTCSVCGAVYTEAIPMLSSGGGSGSGSGSGSSSHSKPSGSSGSTSHSRATGSSHSGGSVSRDSDTANGGSGEAKTEATGVTYEWAEDFSSCTATWIDPGGEEETVTETADAVYTLTREASCTETGRETYTASFDNELFEKQTVENTLAALGHDWGEWTDMGDGENHERACAVCGETQTEPHSWGEITLTETGSETIYTCTDCGAQKTETAGVDATADSGQGGHTALWIILGVVVAGGGVTGGVLLCRKKKVGRKVRK